MVTEFHGFFDGDVWVGEVDHVVLDVHVVGVPLRVDEGRVALVVLDVVQILELDVLRPRLLLVLPGLLLFLRVLLPFLFASPLFTEYLWA